MEPFLEELDQDEDVRYPFGVTRVVKPRLLQSLVELA